MKLSHRSSVRPRRVLGVPLRTHRGSRDGGYVLAQFALLLVPLMLMVGLSVDVGYWYNRASDIQKAADAAALAGVVWLPDVETAREHAIIAAQRNGFDDDDPNIDVSVEREGERRLRVEITDDRVSSFMFRSVGGEELTLTREAMAEYVLPVPLGSPRNYFGTGRLLDDPELLYQSVNPTCTSKVNGDRHQSKHFGPLSGATLTSCPSTPTDDEYRPEGYGLYIEAPEGRTDTIDVLLYDAKYWTCPTELVRDQNYTDHGRERRIYGPALYWDGRNWRDLEEGSSAIARFVYYYRERCVAGEDHPDSHRQGGSEDYTFTLYSDNGTPLDETDDTIVPGCERTYTAATPFDLTYLGSERWNRHCQITTAMPAGRYRLQVRNSGISNSTSDGSNQWGLVAKYASASGDGLCDGRDDPLCPRVYGRDAISVYANTSDGVASFFMAEIDPEHDGKTLQLELWDPGEGGEHIEFLEPTGTDSWAAVDFEWDSFNNDGSAHESGSGDLVDVTESKFNGRLLRIRIPLDDYDPPADNRWWKIRYTFTSGVVTDRTTWSARVIGDPVHLVEEEID